MEEGGEEEERQPIDSYLEGLTREGKRDSEGGFTLTRENALAKLSGSQLPFDAAWIVKIVQAAVASKTKEPIDIKLSPSETVITFTPGRAWRVAEIEGAFYTPDLCGGGDISHLVSGLWAITIRGNRDLLLTVPREPEGLVWSTQGLVRSALEVPAVRVRLAVSHGPLGGGGNLLSRMLDASRPNAQISAAVYKHCFTCPVPLTLDGRRVDALQSCYWHSLPQDAAPLAVGFADADLPPLDIPRGTYEWKRSASIDGMVVAAHLVGDQVESGIVPRQSAPLAYLVAYHTERARTNKYGGATFHQTLAPSTCHWVVDGTAVACEQLDMPPSTCAVGIFLSAQGLTTDLSTFALRESAELDRRRSLAGRLMVEALRLVTTPTHLASQQKQRGQAREVAVAIGIIGLCITPANLLLGGAVVLGGIVMGRSSRKRTVTPADMEAGLAQLSHNLAQKYSP